MKGGKDFVWKSSRVMYNKMCCYCGLCLFTIALIVFACYFKEIFGLNTEDVTITNIA